MRRNSVELYRPRKQTPRSRHNPPAPPTGRQTLMRPRRQRRLRIKYWAPWVRCAGCPIGGAMRMCRPEMLRDHRRQGIRGAPEKPPSRYRKKRWAPKTIAMRRRINPGRVQIWPTSPPPIPHFLLIGSGGSQESGAWQESGSCQETHMRQIAGGGATASRNSN